jgi:hypothetical protein
MGNISELPFHSTVISALLWRNCVVKTKKLIFAVLYGTLVVWCWQFVYMCDGGWLTNMYMCYISVLVYCIIFMLQLFSRTSWKLIPLKNKYVFRIIKPIRCTYVFLYFILEWNSTCFGQFLCPSSGAFHCTHSNGICHTGDTDSLCAGSGCSILILSETCRVSFRNKIEKLMLLVGYIIRNLSRCAVTWTLNKYVI